MRWAILALLVFVNTASADPCGVSCNGGWASGTTVEGAPEGKTYVVTNRHVVNLGGKSVLFNGKTYPATLVKTHQTCDLALIMVNEKLKASPLASVNPTKGTAFTLQGYGQNSGGFDKVRKDTVANIKGSSLSTRMFISPGDSGSGLVNEDGELIGVIWGCWGPGGGPGIGIPVSEVRSLIPNLAPAPRPKYRF